jgi:predicted nucleotidyltransferase
MDMYKQKWTRLQYGIFRFLCIKSGQTTNLRGIAKAVGASPTAVSKSLKGLADEGIAEVKKSKNMNLLIIRLNRDSPRAVHLKRVENLKMIYESGLADFLYNEFPGCAVVLFGSYSLGEDMSGPDVGSDIDIAVIGAKERGVDTAKFGRLLERDVKINFYESWGKIHKNLKDNILNGMLLSGGVEL